MLFVHNYYYYNVFNMLTSVAQRYNKLQATHINNFSHLPSLSPKFEPRTYHKQK